MVAPAAVLDLWFTWIMTTSATTEVSTKDFDMRPRTCPICGIEPSAVLGMRGGNHHRYGLGVETTIARCGRCSLVFPNPFPYAVSPATLYGDPEKYFAGADEDAKVEGFRTIAREAIRRSGKTRPWVLDVGSGRGEALRAFRAEGIEQVVGLELADAMIEHVRSRHGIEVLHQTLEQFAASTDQRFDIIVMAAVIEHVYDPDAMMAAARKLTSPGSVIYIDVPCEPSLLILIGNGMNRVLRKPAVFNLAPTFPPFHVFGFNVRSLRMLLDKHGFDLVDEQIWADPHVPATSKLSDRLKAAVATQINRLANVLKLANNMTCWAIRR